MAQRLTSLPTPANGRRIGLLGGSFNPAHEGHVAISQYAIKRLKLDEVWWLVSPQNPLKSPHGMGSLRIRLNLARAKCRDEPRITATDLEKELGTVFTTDTLSKITKTFPQAKFVWLMGADNLMQIHQWQGWQKIFRLVPIAVFRRYRYADDLFIAPAAKHFAANRCDLKKAAALAEMKAPVWLTLDNPLDKHSGTALRKSSITRERIQTRGDDKENEKNQGDLFQGGEINRSSQKEKARPKSGQGRSKKETSCKETSRKETSGKKGRAKKEASRKETGREKTSPQKGRSQKIRSKKSTRKGR